MSNVPKLRFKEFNGEWNKDKFGELCGFEQGIQVDVEHQHREWADNLVRFLRIENYTQKSQDFRFIPKELAKKKSINDKEIAIVRYGATAGFIGRGFNGVLANNLFKLKPNHKLLHNEYLYHYLKSYKAFHFFQSEMAGGAMPALSFGIVKALKLPYPSKQEQEQIASFLISVDTKIEHLTKKEALLQQYKKGVMQKIFNQEIRFKADDGREFKQWEEKKLGEITKKTSIKNKDNLDLPVYSISNQHGFIPQSEQFEGLNSKSRNYDTSMYKIIGKNTFAYNPARINVGSIGYSSELEDVIISSLYVCFKTSKLLDDYFLLQYIETFEFNKNVLRNVEGGVREYLFYENFSSIKIKLPTIEEQTKIANFLSSIDSKIEQVQKQFNSTKEFKKALLQQMFV